MNVTSNRQFERSYINPSGQNEIEFYEERLSKRRERAKEEEKLNEFLNNSLRDSNRLKALERSKRLNANTNPAFERDADTVVSELTDFDVSKLVEGICGRRKLKNAMHPSDLEWIQKHVNGLTFRANYHSSGRAIPKILEHYHNNNIVLPPVAALGDRARSDLHAQLSSSVDGGAKKTTKNSAFQYQLLELKQLMESPQIANFLFAYDECAREARRQREIRKLDNARETNMPNGTSVDTPISKQSQSSLSAGNSPQHKVGDKRPVKNTETTRTIKSKVPNCYAIIHQTESDIPIKTVFLEKGNQPLGATVRNERDSIVVGRIVVGGVAEKSGLLQEGDELLSVNKIDLTGKDVNEVADILARMSGRLEFKVAAVDGTLFSFPKHQRGNTIHLRALFTYNPIDDAYIPCKDIGLSFQRGDVLHVTNVQDPNWWQAYRDDDSGRPSIGPLGSELAGLIPSPEYQYNREKLRKQLGMEDTSSEILYNQQNDSSILCLKKNKKHQTASGWIYNRDPRGSMDFDGGKKRNKRGGNKKSTYYPSDIEGRNIDSNIITYEEVQLFLPQPHRKRPVVFVGPDLVGRHELVRQIVDRDPDSFSLVKKHTTCDSNSADFILVSKDVFQHMQNQNDFIETGIFEKNMYGTSKKEVLNIVNEGKTAVMILQPESLPLIRKTTLLPYIIFVSPPMRINELRNLRQELDNTRSTDQELHQTINRAKAIDQFHGHLFDTVIYITSMSKAVSDAFSKIGKLDRDPQWVPSGWLHNNSGSRPVSNVPI